MKKRSNKIYDCKRFGVPQIRVWKTKERRKSKGAIISPSVLLKCGCCEQQIRIYWGGGSIEINGVNGSVADWKDILLPMLDEKTNKEDPLPKRKK